MNAQTPERKLKARIIESIFKLSKVQNYESENKQANEKHLLIENGKKRI